jgi:hypothetical protein
MKGCFGNEKEIVANMPSNMSKSQQTALSKLKRDKDIVIKPADKNLGLCIMDKAWYMDECRNILSNKDSYIQIDMPNRANSRPSRKEDQYSHRQIYSNGNLRMGY